MLSTTCFLRSTPRAECPPDTELQPEMDRPCWYNLMYVDVRLDMNLHDAMVRSVQQDI